MNLKILKNEAEAKLGIRLMDVLNEVATLGQVNKFTEKGKHRKDKKLEIEK
jgi:hypothetical protein